ncbi:MAG TPA: UpxY family transcription antiterminator [Candidatus Angelobacter sp.]|nr:UpxY family transcription antiterminator [Candidatus Angelobacter sp.]
MQESLQRDGLSWYAAYTRSRHEKRVADDLLRRDVEFYLPLYETVSRWKDRKMRLSLPLFSSYVFVKIDIQERLRVLDVPGIVRLVGFKGKPVALPDGEMEKLQRGLGAALLAEPHPFLTVGRKVRIVRGPFEGFDGILLRRRATPRVVLSIELIQRSICIEVDIDMIQPIRTKTAIKNPNRSIFRAQEQNLFGSSIVVSAK